MEVQNSDDVQKSEQMAEIVLFRDLLKEMRSHIDFVLLTRLTDKMSMKIEQSNEMEDLI